VQISGEIVIDGESASFANATAFIYLEDVSRADDAARMLGRAKLTAVAHQQGAESRVPFAVESIDAPSIGDAALRVHISLDGDENVLARDLVSTSHNSATEGRSLEIAVKPV
jgi:hypothetical protein